MRFSQYAVVTTTEGILTDTLTTDELAKRWHFHPGYLRQLRMQGKGPPWFRPNPRGSRVLYRLTDVEAYEATQVLERGR